MVDMTLLNLFTVLIAIYMVALVGGNGIQVPVCEADDVVNTCYAEYLAGEMKTLNSKISRLSGKLKKHCGKTANNTCDISSVAQLNELRGKLDVKDSKLETLLHQTNLIEEQVNDCATQLSSHTVIPAPSETTAKSTTAQSQQTTTPPLPKDCSEIYSLNQTKNNLYSIYPSDGLSPIEVYCHDGWTVFQRREDGSVDFLRNWTEYRSGFGSVFGEHWLGNENLARITAQRSYILHIELRDWNYNQRYAKYDHFHVADEDDNFRLTVGQHSGTALDSLKWHNQSQFSTVDRDNDLWHISCARVHDGGWWYTACGYAQLNNPYYYNNQDALGNGIIWYHWLGPRYSLKYTEMRLKPSPAH